MLPSPFHFRNANALILLCLLIVLGSLPQTNAWPLKLSELLHFTRNANLASPATGLRHLIEPTHNESTWTEHSPLTRKSPIHYIKRSSNDNIPSTIPWSTEPLLLLRGNSLHVLHNFTSTTEPNGYQRTQHIAREVVPHYSRLLRFQSPHVEHTKRLSKRGFFTDPDKKLETFNGGGSLPHVSWNWKESVDDVCPVVIELCFTNINSQQALRPIVDAAIQQWHDALGPDRGVRFKMVDGDQHGNFAGVCWRRFRQAVHVLETPGTRERSYNGIGWRLDTGGQMEIKFDPGFMASTSENIAAMVHELGHVMGLEHEHQRYDARQLIEIRCQNFEYYDDMVNALRAFNEAEDDDVTMDEFCTPPADPTRRWNPRQQFLAIKDNTDLIPGHIHLESFLPFAPGDDGSFIIDFVYSLKQDGDNLPEDRHFDWNSIMLYGSDDDAIDAQHPVMVRRADGATWTAPQQISPGDVRAVKAMYPDL